MELAQSKALWMAATAINEEIHELTPSLLSPTVGADVSYSIQTEGEPVSETPIRCLLKPHADGGLVLLTVNLDDAVIKATYQFPGGLGMVHPLFEERPQYELDPGQTTFEDMYALVEAAVARVRG